MAQLLVQDHDSEKCVLLQKKMIVAGSSAEHDVYLSTLAPGVGFTLHRDELGYCILPSEMKIFLNGAQVKKRMPLLSCHRLHWLDAKGKEGSAVFVNSDIPVLGGPESAASTVKSLEILQNLANELPSAVDQHAIEKSLESLLAYLVEASGAEEGYLLTEMKENAGWEMFISAKSDEATQTKKELFSQTILSDAIAKRAPIYIENIDRPPLCGAPLR